jgi:hypothetical protein
MTRHHGFLCLSFILCTLCARSQANVYEHIGIQQGLPSTTVYSCFQDSKGYIWFGTDAGACRFDGYSYRTYDLTDGLKDNHIFNFYEDSQGRIWFLTYLNKLCYFQNEAIHSPEFQTPIQIGRSDGVKKLSNDNFMIPPMLVQPFIENAIIHGILHLETKGEIHVNFHVENDQVICIVQDNGIGRIQSAALNAKDSPGHKSKAMNSTQERMELLKTVKDSQASI